MNNKLVKILESKSSIKESSPARKVTNQLLTMIEDGLLDKDTVIMACVKWMSEDDVIEMCRANEFIMDEDEEEENEDEE